MKVALILLGLLPVCVTCYDLFHGGFFKHGPKANYDVSSQRRSLTVKGDLRPLEPLSQLSSEDFENSEDTDIIQSDENRRLSRHRRDDSSSSESSSSESSDEDKARRRRPVMVYRQTQAERYYWQTSRLTTRATTRPPTTAARTTAAPTTAAPTTAARTTAAPTTAAQTSTFSTTTEIVDNANFEETESHSLSMSNGDQEISPGDVNVPIPYQIIQ